MTRSWKEREVPVDYCPECNAELDRITHPVNAIPRTGDYSFCIYCGLLLTFTDECKLIPAKGLIEDHIKKNKQLKIYDEALQCFEKHLHVKPANPL